MFRKPRNVSEETEWISHFTSKFSPPDQELEEKFSKELDKGLKLPGYNVVYVITIKNFTVAIRKLKKKQTIA